MKNDSFFSTELLLWNNDHNTRVMPWKGEKNPYKIWISEIILQQTRVEYGIDYYNRFILEFPDVQSLAFAPENRVFKLWEGLGYYSRCRNMIATAKIICEEYDNRFPDTYEAILKLKGIGPYTASAIASFAFGLPYAVLDGNVFRVLARFFDMEIPVDTTIGKRIFSEKANLLLGKHPPASYNQAIMDFGATICKPKMPLCKDCPLQNKCAGFKKQKVAFLPVKGKKLIKRNRFFNYLVVEYDSGFYIKKRTGKDIWQNLHEFILIETDKLITVNELMRNIDFKNIFQDVSFEIKSMSTVSKQVLSHQVISGRFFHINIKTPLKVSMGFKLIRMCHLQILAFPKFITAYLKD